MENEERIGHLQEAIEATEDIARAFGMIDETLNELLSMSQGIENDITDVGMKVYSTDVYGYYEETRDARAVVENIRARTRMVTADLSNNKATMDSRKADCARIVESLNNLIGRLTD